jgi:hypothetical protein
MNKITLINEKYRDKISGLKKLQPPKALPFLSWRMQLMVWFKIGCK